MRVRFEPPGEVDLAFPDGGTRRLTDVTAIHGRFVAWRGDTVHVAVRSVRKWGGPVPGVSARRATAAVALGPGRFTEQRQLSVARTALALAGVTVTAVAVLFVLLSGNT